jgi:hypothetical protein
MTTELKNAILKQIGISETEFKENIQDYFDARNGISGFTYYSDTHEFSMENQELINDLLDEYSDELGMSSYELITSFNMLKNNLNFQDKKDIHAFLSNNTNIEQGQITNTLAWFCVEQLAFELDQ